jgi:hypothetical protein|tara:strand:- start:127 stop:393 length:267 start_codon:yes stop_codon:yes gene_type:complete
MNLSNLPSDVLNKIFNHKKLNQTIIELINVESFLLTHKKAMLLKSIAYYTAINEYNMLEELCMYIPLFDCTTVYFDQKEWYIDNTFFI